MALSGTLETFSLPDVLRLLASTKKTGVLALQGDRGAGRVWVADGDLVAADADRAAFADLEGTLFELLRFEDAGFEFEPGVEPVDRDEPRAVDAALDVAQARLDEWRDIEAVVPSLDVWVRMVPEIDGPMTVSPGQWRMLASVGTGLSGRALSQHLEQGEFDVCRQLRDLVDAGMVEVDDAPAEPPVQMWAADAAATSSPVVDSEPSFVEPALSSHEVSTLGADLASFVAAGTLDEPTDVVGLDEPTDIDDAHDVGDAVNGEEHPVPVGPVAIDGVESAEHVDSDEHTDAAAGIDTVQPTTDDAGEPVEDDEDILAQLSHLSPKAAAAIEAVAAPDADGQPAAEAEHDGDAPRRDDIDQNLLLRFLSSSKP